MFKKTLILLAIALPLLAYTAVPEVYDGTFPNGATLKWACKPGTSGAVRFQLVTPTGEMYGGVLSCGEPV